MNLNINQNYIVARTEKGPPLEIRVASCGDLVKNRYNSSGFCNLHFSSRLEDQDVRQWVEFLALCDFKFTYNGRQTDVALNYLSRSKAFHQVRLDYADYVSPAHAMIAYTALRYLVWVGCEDLRKVCLALHQAYPEWEPLKCLYYCHYVMNGDYQPERALVPCNSLFKALTLGQLKTRLRLTTTQHQIFCPPVIAPIKVKFAEMRELACKGSFDIIDEIVKNMCLMHIDYEGARVVPLFLTIDGMLYAENVVTGRIFSDNLTKFKQLTALA